MLDTLDTLKLSIKNLNIKRDLLTLLNMKRELNGRIGKCTRTIKELSSHLDFYVNNPDSIPSSFSDKDSYLDLESLLKDKELYSLERKILREKQFITIDSYQCKKMSNQIGSLSKRITNINKAIDKYIYKL